MKRPMTAPTGTAPLTPEDLLETIARMDKTGGGRQPSTLALAALTGLATAAALVVSVWLLVSFLAPDTLPPARVSQTEVRVQAVAAAEERTAGLLLSPDPDALPERLLDSLEQAEEEVRMTLAETAAKRTPPAFQWPCQGTVTSPFGTRHIFGADDFHRGTDIAAPLGTEILAAAPGTVCFAGEKGSYGNLIQVDHGSGYVTRYAHCSAFLAQEGDWVDQGQPVALVGSTGRSTGPHCHFEIRRDGEPVDAETLLP